MTDALAGAGLDRAGAQTLLTAAMSAAAYLSAVPPDGDYDSSTSRSPGGRTTRSGSGHS
jgi:hypothetical protein